jgi:YbbR domain-containing protein
MISFLRQLFFADFWLKLFSLALAVLIWLTVSFAVQKERSPLASLVVYPHARTFSRLPVVPMSGAQDVSDIKVVPAEVEVTVQGERNLVSQLSSSDIHVSVDLTGITKGKYIKKRIQVATLAGISLFRVDPEEVEIVFPSSQ